VLNSEQLLSYLSGNPNAKAVEFVSSFEEDISYIKQLLKEANFTKEKISSFFTSAEKLNQLKESITTQANINFERLSFEELKALLNEKTQDIILNINTNFVPRSRILQGALGAAPSNITQVNSLIFNNMSNYSMSGLWVGLFLLIMLGIGISCLMNLKTNDRFARQNLWVGRES
jgi:hypothetical protein